MAQIQAKAGKILTDVAGYISVRTMEIGLTQGIFKELLKHEQGIRVDELAKIMNFDAWYLDVWCKSAYGSELLEYDDQKRYRIAQFVGKLLLDRDFPGYVGGIPVVMMASELFDGFSKNLATGERIWWDQTSPNWIKSVIETTRPMYTRLLNVGIPKIPGLEELLNQGASVMELASGSGDGLTRTALKYPNCTFLGIDGDDFSINLAKTITAELNLQDRISYTKSMFEDIDYSGEFDVVTITASMHECRDLDKVTSQVHKSLKPGGYFVISDFPYPENVKDLRTIPARIMTGIQFFESQIDDLLLPTKDYIDLLNKHGFTDVASFDLTPTHMIIYGKK